MTTSSSSISSISATSTSSKRLSGLISGLDTDTLVQQLTYGTQTKIDKVQQNRQIALWKQTSYQEVITALSEFTDKYLSSTSSNSILNANFFNISTIKNSSSNVSISGSSSAAQNMVITQISQLARQASFTSSHQVSNQAITTGAIQESWTPQAVAGTSITLNYGSKDYKIAVDNTLEFDVGDDISKITDSLNDAISKIDDLNGKIKFSVGGDGKVSITKTDLSASDFSIKDGTANLLSGLGLSKTTEASSAILGGDTKVSDFFSNTLKSGSYLEFTIDGKVQKLSIASSVALSPDDDLETFSKKLETALKEGIRANTNLSGMDVSVDSSGNVTFTGSGTITGGSENLLQGLGLTKTGDTYSSTGTASRDELVKTHLVDSLAGTTLTFTLDGVSKKITFNESEKSQYTDAAGLQGYLQTKLEAAYGSGRITVSQTDGKLSIETTDPTSVVSIVSSDASGVLGKNAALHVYAGESNRINTSKTLQDISENLGTALTSDTDSDTYSIKVNDAEFTFKKTQSLAEVINTINNDSQANVQISYSTVTDHFTVTAKNGGENSKVEISDLNGSNLATALFGTATTTTDAEGKPVGGDYVVSQGQNAKLSVSFDGNASNAIEIERTENQFSLDGVNLSLLSETATGADPIKFTVENNADDLYEKLKTFVDDYNAIISLASGKVSEKKDTDENYLPLTDAQKKEMSETQITSWETKAKVGLLQGDTLLNSLVTDFRRAMTDQVASIQSALYTIGIQTKSDDYTSYGKLEIDETKLKSALTENPDKVAALFTGSDGIASRLQSVIQKNVGTYGTDGLLVTKAGKANSTYTTQNTISKMVEDYDAQIKKLKATLETQQERYYAQFTALEQYLSTMNSQASWFTQATSSDS